MQKPLAPEESLKHLVDARRASRPKLFVAEPQIGKPIAMTWDERGRLWVAETVDYPNEMQPKGKGRDRISICEDTDGDGKADKVTVFADNLSIPTSLCFANGGVIVAQAPDMLFLKDTDGDGKADVRKVLFTGFGTRDTHAGPSNLRYGLDNWIYGDHRLRRLRRRRSAASGTASARASSASSPTARSSSSSAARTTTPGASASARRGCSSARRPTATRASTCRSRTATTSRSAAGRPSVLPNIADSQPLLPDHRERPPGRLARRLHRRRRASALYTARTYPKQYWNRTAFVAEPTGHLVATFTLQPRRHRLPLAQRLEPAGQRRRVDLADHGRGRARRATSG